MKRKTVLFLVGLSAITLILPPMLSTRREVIYHQFYVQQLQEKYGVELFRTALDHYISAYSLGVNMLRGKPVEEKPNFENPEGLFTYIFSWIPPKAIVYPTEGFYYWMTDLPQVGKISGNIRVADLDNKEISFAYFTITDEKDRITKFYKIDEANGLKVEKISDHVYKVIWKNQAVKFILPHLNYTPPNIELLSDEEFVGRILDDSALRLLLIYNNQTNSFYELLDEEKGVTDRLDPIDEHLSIGKRSGFIFYEDNNPSRKILVGVNLSNVNANNYLDGPGDQVPFRLNFKDQLNKAYPNTMLGDGTDDHGVYLNKPEWVRIAVSPYHRYASLAELVERESKCKDRINKSIFWTCLTKEWWNTSKWRQGVFDQLKEQGKFDQAQKKGLIIP